MPNELEMSSLELNNTENSALIKYIDEVANNFSKSLPRSSPNVKMIVTIPAKNEAEEIHYTINAIINQKDLDGDFFDKSLFEILILCHNCSDDTKQKIESISIKFSTLQLHVLELNSETANTVGSARRVLMNIASQRLNSDNNLIITTDADTIPDSNWLVNLQTYIESDFDLICGLINVKRDNLQKQPEEFLKAKDEYLLLKAKLESQILPNIDNPWPRHGYNWGPNLAIKKGVYDAIGGIKPLHFLEDVDMFNNVFSKGYKIRHSNNVVVTTSTRLDPRCNEGFGAELRVWNEFDGVEYNVEGLNKLLIRYNIYQLIRQFYKKPSNEILLEICNKAKIDFNQITDMFSNSEIWEAMIVKMENYLLKNESWNNQNLNTSVFQACEEIENYFK